MKIIFIVDDDPAHVRVWERVLKRAGYGVVTAPNGADALKVLEHTTVDLILLDVVMPDKDGLELLMTLRDRKLSVPVISMTGSGSSEMSHTLLAQSRLLGAQAVLAKPFSEGELLQAVEAVLGGRGDGSSENPTSVSAE